MPNLSWNEVKARAIRFAREWSSAASERADKQTFYNEFFEVFGIRRRLVALFEANVRNLHGNTSAIDLLWRGKLIAIAPYSSIVNGNGWNFFFGSMNS
jgi:hypothetical protein